MLIKQNADCSITIRRFDTGENITFEKDTIIDVDIQTAIYLKNLKIKDASGTLVTDFTEVE